MRVNGISKKPLTLFVRIVLTFVLCLVPLYLLVLLFFNQAQAILSGEIADSMQAEADYFLNQFETEVSRIQKQMLDLLNDDDLLKLSSAGQSFSAYGYITAINRLQKRLLLLRDSSLLINSVSVHILAEQKTVQAGPPGESAVRNIGNMDQLLAGYATAKKSGPFGYRGKNQFMSISDDLYNGRGIPVRYIIDIEFSQAAIVNFLSNYGKTERGRVVLANDSHEYVATYNLYDISESDWSGISNSFERGSANISFRGERQLLVSARSDALRLTLLKFIPVREALSSLRSYQIWVLSFTLAVVIIMIPFAGYTYKKIHKPLKLLVDSFDKVERGGLETRIDHREWDEFDTLFISFNHMVAGIRNLMRQLAEEHSAVQKAELKQLQSQINPHFLYNSFFLLHRLIREKQWENATEFSKMMGKYFQYITRNSNFPIAIEKEVDHARIYAEIQSLRFAGHISIVFDPLPENFIALTVPPLILQPLLENAFIHGLEDLEEEGRLHVSFAVLDQEGERVFRISVEDNGNLLPDEALMNLQSTLGGREMPQSLTGLLNINYRLKLLYQNSGCLQADRSELGGLRISILIPASGTAGEPSDA